MTYPAFAARALPVLALALVALLVAESRRDRTPEPAAATAILTPVIRPVIVTNLVSVTQVYYQAASPTAASSTPPPPPAPRPPEARPAPQGPLLVSPGPTTSPELPEDPEKAWLARFDHAMDREFARLEQRERGNQDPEDRAMVQRLKERLTALDDLWTRADAAGTDERIRLQGEAQKLMGEIIQLGRADRNQRLTAIARSYGLDDPAEVAAFIQGVDRAYAETHLDWGSLFNRGVTPPGP